jgi:hypothetical protein
MRKIVDRFGRIVISKKSQAVPRVAVKDGILVCRGAAEGDLEKAVAADREHRHRKLGNGLRS